MNPLKCAFGVTSGKFLGFIVHQRGIEVDRSKIDAIVNMPEPRNIHELKSLQGKLAYIRRFISNLAGRCQPFSRLMKKGVPFEWDESCRNAFTSIKVSHESPVLAAPIPGKPLILYISAQERSVGALLAQENDEGCQRTNIGRLFSRSSLPAEWELTDELPDEEVFMVESPWSMYFDGAAHRDGAGAGVVFYTPEADILPYSFTLTRRCSNNVAEYQALILGLETAVDMKQLHLRVYGDSKLVVNQLLGVYDVKKPELIPYYKYASNSWDIGNVTIEHIPRNFNQQADSLIMMVKKNTYHIFVHEIEKEDWRHLIDYLNHGKLPEDPKKRVDIRRRAPRFIYYKGTLYRRSFDGVFLRCLGEDEAMQAMEEAHSGICGAHQSGPKLHFRIKRMGYYWPTMVKDCIDLLEDVKLVNFMAISSVNLLNHCIQLCFLAVRCLGFGYSWTTSKIFWRTHFYFGGDDYFSKWAEAVPLREVKKENVVDFIRLHIIYRYGVPRYIITDNGKPFCNVAMNKLCEKFHFKQYNSSMYYAANGLAEAFNKTLCNLLKKIVDKSKRDWHLRIGEALWAYRTTFRTPTQATPYALVYGVEAVLPLECQIPSLRIAIQEGLSGEDNVRLRLEELEALDEKRLEAQQRIECYQARLSKAFNKHVRPALSNWRTSCLQVPSRSSVKMLVFSMEDSSSCAWVISPGSLEGLMLLIDS
nr:uncharacterized protein LOC113740942 [Coffea arabica]